MLLKDNPDEQPKTLACFDLIIIARVAVDGIIDRIRPVIPRYPARCMDFTAMDPIIQLGNDGIVLRL